MASNRINDVPNNSSAFLPAPGMNPSDGGRPIHFGFFGGHPMDVNVDAGWEGATLHNGFHPRFKADELTTMTPVAGGVRDDNNSADASGAAGPERKHPSMTPAGQGNVRSQILSDSKDDDIISISSYEDDGAKHCHIPGDSTYRAPGASRSRIKDVPNSDFTRVTRSKGKTTNASSTSNNAPTKDDIVTEDAEVTERPKKTRRAKKTAKSKPIVMSSEETSDEPQSSQRTPVDPPLTQPRPPLDSSPLPRRDSRTPKNKGKARSKRTRSSRESGSDNPRPSKRNDIDDPIELSDSSEFSEIFSASELGKLVKGGKKCKESRAKLLKKINGLFRSSKRWRNNFLDLEAEEDEDPSEEGEGYDLSDPFIDDSDVGKEDGTADADAPFPGLELEDFARQASQERAKQIDEDRCIARAMTRHDAMVHSAMEQGSGSGASATSKHETTTQTSPKRASQSAVSKEREDHEMSSSEDEFGVKFYRAQFREAIRRSRQAHERRLAEERNARAAAAAITQASPSTPGARGGDSRRPPPSYDSIYSSPLPPYTPAPGPGIAGQTITPPDSSNAVPRAIPRPPTTPSGQWGSGPNTQNPVNGGQPRRLRFSFPQECEVTDPKLHDTLLAADYASLVPLRRGIFVPWSNAPGRGLVRFSAWKEQTPSMDPAKAYEAIRFQTCQQFINPSRASPADLEVKEITSGLHSHSFRLHAYLKGQPANMLQGKLHTQEFERLVGFLCMSFGIPELHANLSRDSMHFVTRPVSRDGSAAQNQAPGMFSNNPSPSTKRAVANRLLIDHFALDSRNDVPIYDARDAVDFNLSMDLPSLASKLPLLSEGEIPFGSFVVVGYTASVYKANNGNWTLSCNIRWAIIIGSPAETTEH